MATEYEQRLRTAILKQLAEERRKFEPEIPKEEMDEIIAGAYEGLDRRSATEFKDVSGEGLEEKLYRLSACDYDGLMFDVFALVDTLYSSKTTRIKSIFAYIEGAMAVIYNAEYGEDGIDFDVPDFVAVPTALPPLPPAEKIRQEFARIVGQYKRDEITDRELDEELNRIVPLR